MALTDDEIKEAIALGASDDEIAALDAEGPSVPTAIPSAPRKPLDYAKEAVMRMTPVGSVAEISGQLSGERPSSGLRAGLAAADIASLGAATKLKSAYAGARAAAPTVLSALLPAAKTAAISTVPTLAAGAGGGGAAWVAEEAGAPLPVQLAAGLAGGLAGGRAAGVRASAMPKPAPIVEELQELGGKPTAAMLAPNPLTEGLDLSARTNPLAMFLSRGRGIAEADETMSEAVKKLAQKRFGLDVTAPRGEEAGEALKGALESVATQRAAAYKPIVEKLKDVPGYLTFQKEVGTAAKAVSEDVSSVHYEAFQKALNAELKGKQSPAGIDKAISSLKARFKKEMGGQPLSNAETHDFNVMLNTVKDKFYTGLNTLSSTAGKPGNLGDQLRAAKGDYATATQALEPLSKALALRTGNPEAIGQALLNSGSENIKKLLKQADFQTSATLRKEMALSILREASSGDVKSGINSKALQTALNRKYKDILPLLGEEGKSLRDIADSLRITKATTLGEVNPPSSGIRVLQGTNMLLPFGAAINPAILGGLAAKTGMDVGYNVLGPEVLRGVQQASRIPWSMARTGGIAVGRGETSRPMVQEPRLYDLYRGR